MGSYIKYKCNDKVKESEVERSRVTKRCKTQKQTGRRAERKALECRDKEKERSKPTKDRRKNRTQQNNERQLIEEG